MSHKISQLTERVTSVLGTDLLHLIGNTSTTPVGLKVQVKNFLNGLLVDLPQVNSAAFFLTANVASNATAATLTAGQLVLQSNTSAPYTTQNRYGLVVQNLIQNGASNTTGQIAAAWFQLDVANSAVVASNTYGIIIDHTLNTNVAASRTVSPTAFLAFKDFAGTGGNTTTYLFEAGAQGANVSANLTNAVTNVVLSVANTTTATHKVRCRFNGTDYWLMLTAAV